MGERWIHPWINDVSVGCLATGKKIAEFQVVIEPMTSVTAVWCCHQRATRTSSGIRHFTVLFFLPCLASTEGLTMWFSLNVMQERWKGAARTREWIVQIMVAWQKLKEHLEKLRVPVKNRIHHLRNADRCLHPLSYRRDVSKLVRLPRFLLIQTVSLALRAPQQDFLWTWYWKDGMA